MRNILNVFCILAVLALCGCGGGGSGGTPSVSRFAGNYLGGWVDTQSPSHSGVFSIAITTDGIISGSLHDAVEGKNYTMTNPAGQTDQSISPDGTVHLQPTFHDGQPDRYVWQVVGPLSFQIRPVAPSRPRTTPI